jgi:hypothetical protein
VAWASELYWPTERRMSAKLVPTSANRGCHVVSVMNPYGRILDFLDRSCYFFYQVAPQLYSRGWVDPVPDRLLRKSDSAGNRTPTSGPVARRRSRYYSSAENVSCGRGACYSKLSLKIYCKAVRTENILHKLPTNSRQPSHGSANILPSMLMRAQLNFNFSKPHLEQSMFRNHI